MTGRFASLQDRPTVLRLAALAAAALGLAWLVGRDGTPGWQALRALVVVAAAAAGAAAVLRLGARRRGVALLVIGLAAAGAGAGVAVTWAPKAGPPLTTVAGVVALLGGLACLAFALADLTGGARGWLRWALALALGLAAAVLLLSLAIAVAATNVPPTALGDETPADQGLPFEDAAFPTSDGVTLSGWYVPSQNGAAVVLLHGSGSTRSAVLDQAAVLAGGGYGVLLPDARGHGGSGGRAMDFGWFGDADVAGALDYLAGRADVDAGRLAVVGMSMGGEEAIGAAAGDPRLQAVVA
ncbi:MAG: Dipeptidylaminopeptidase/acylaminoacyl-peptidase -like protein, partial [Actinobacteria bacterium]|nr:Dipeptidylaminopeptidase/acylaminoacyl-peptidase -like protein [Actinomycetota bacterium]